MCVPLRVLLNSLRPCFLEYSKRVHKLGCILRRWPGRPSSVVGRFAFHFGFSPTRFARGLFVNTHKKDAPTGLHLRALASATCQYCTPGVLSTPESTWLASLGGSLLNNTKQRMPQVLLSSLPSRALFTTPSGSARARPARRSKGTSSEGDGAFPSYPFVSVVINAASVRRHSPNGRRKRSHPSPEFCMQSADLSF